MKSKKIKLIIFHPYSSLGGADKSISRIINNLNTLKYDIIFICLNDPYIKKFLKKRVKIIKLKSKRTIFSIFEIQNILNKFNKNEKIIFISNQNFANIVSIFIVKRYKNIKLVLVERNHLDEFNYSIDLFDFFKKRILKLLIKITYRYSDLIIGNSNKLSNDLSKFIKRKVTCIYNPANDKSVISLSKKRINFKKKNNLVITIGRLEQQKDQLTLIESILNIKDTNLLIIGYGSLNDKLNNFIKENDLNDRVQILNKISNPYPYLKKADLFVLCSLYEGFPNVITEAITLNVPIISSNCNSGPKEILLNNKIQLFEKGNSKQLTNKIKFFFENKSKFVRKTLFLKKTLSRFNPDKIIREYEQEFNKLLR